MNPNFDHFILTRFNLASPGRESRLRSDPAWLTLRFELFERFCLPSLVAQTNQNFRWLIFFEHDTPDEFKLRITALADRYSSIEPQWVDSLRGPSVEDLLSAVLASDKPFLLTSRLDNDDALAADFVEKLQASVPDQVDAPVFLNFPLGFNYQSEVAYLDCDYSNAFMACYEPRQDFGTVWVRQHHRVSEVGAVVQIDSEQAMWLQVIHSHNVSNRVRGRRFRSEAVVGFDDIPGLVLKQQSALLMTLDRYVLFPSRRLREIIRASLKKLLKR